VKTLALFSSSPVMENNLAVNVRPRFASGNH